MPEQCVRCGQTLFWVRADADRYGDLVFEPFQVCTECIEVELEMEEHPYDGCGRREDGGCDLAGTDFCERECMWSGVPRIDPNLEASEETDGPTPRSH